MEGKWHHGYFGCFDNPDICIISLFTPCYQFGKNADTVRESFLLHSIGFCVPIVNIYLMVKIRGKIREQQKIDGSRCEDCVSLMMFPICVLVQDSQEAEIIKSRYKEAPDDKNMDRQ